MTMLRLTNLVLLAGFLFSPVAEAAVQDVVLSDVEPQSGVCAPPPATETFQAPEMVWLWFQDPTAHTGDLISAEFVDPASSVAAFVQWDPVASDGSWCFWTYLDLALRPIAGTWRVDLFVNGVLVHAVSFTVEAPPPTSPPSLPPSTIVYLGLGDSVASGYGLGDDTGECRRSPRAYPRLVPGVVRRLNRDVVLWDAGPIACSGATASDKWMDDNDLAAQVLKARQTVDAVRFQNPSQRAVASITIGANDIGWADELQWMPGMTLHTMFCGTSKTLFASYKGQIAARIKSAVSDAIVEFIADDINVVVTEYHNPFNPTSKFWDLVPLCPTDMTTRFRRVDEVITAVNHALAESVSSFRSKRIRLAGIQIAFKSHFASAPVCGSTELSKGNETWIRVPATSEVVLDCFHPNYTGAHEYADSVGAVIAAMFR